MSILNSHLYSIRRNLANYISSLPRTSILNIDKSNSSNLNIDKSESPILENVYLRWVCENKNSYSSHWAIQIGDTFYYYLRYSIVPISGTPLTSPLTSSLAQNSNKCSLRIEFQKGLAENLSNQSKLKVLGISSGLTSEQIMTIGSSLISNFDSDVLYWNSNTIMSIFSELITGNYVLLDDVVIGGFFRLHYNIIHSLKKIYQEFPNFDPKYPKYSKFLVYPKELQHLASIHGVDMEELEFIENVKCRNKKCCVVS